MFSWISWEMKIPSTMKIWTCPKSNFAQRLGGQRVCARKCEYFVISCPWVFKNNNYNSYNRMFLRVIRMLWFFFFIRSFLSVRSLKRRILRRRGPSRRWRMKRTSWHKSLITATKDRANSQRWTVCSLYFCSDVWIWICRSSAHFGFLSSFFFIAQE